MSNVKQINKEEKNKIIKDYLSGDSVNILISKYHHNYNTIKEILDEAYINHSRINNFHTSIPKISLTEEEKDLIVYLYTVQGLGQLACAKAVGHSDVRLVRRVLKERKIKIRNFSESAIISNENRVKYSVNSSYFKTQTHNMAYILGILASDGTVSKRDNTIKLGLSSIDYDYLVMLSKELGSTRPIKTYTTSKGFSNSNLTIVSSEIKKDLSEYNIVPQKTFTFKFPTKLKREYWIDVIRGYYDGDGSVSTSGKHAIKWQIASATKDVLEHIVDFFFEEYNIPKVNIRQERERLYVICYSINATKMIYNHLYNEGCLYLPRKKEKYDKLIKDFTNEIDLQETAVPQCEE